MVVWFVGLIPIGIFSKDSFALDFIGNQTSTQASFSDSFDEIKQTLVPMNSYRIGMDMPLQSYIVSIPTFFLSCESNRPLTNSGQL